MVGLERGVEGDRWIVVYGGFRKSFILPKLHFTICNKYDMSTVYVLCLVTSHQLLFRKSAL